MFCKSILRTTAAAALLIATAGVHAGTVKFNAWAYGNGNNVSVSSPGFNGQAGGFDVTLSGFGAGALAGDFDAYCVELTQSIGLGNSYGNYSIVAAADYFATTPSKLNALNKLIRFKDSNDVMGKAAAGFKDDQSTAMQLAIWNIVYDNDNTIVEKQGAKFSEVAGNNRTQYHANLAGGANFLGADALLQGGASASGDGYQLFVLQSAGQQDQLIWTRGTVPEPTSLALAALALGGAGFAARRRS